MTTCKDCVHYELCKYNAYQEAYYFGKDKEIYISIDNNSACKFFKPVADMVKVVRCKDCWKRYKHCFDKTLEDNDYCSYGERKTD